MNPWESGVGGPGVLRVDGVNGPDSSEGSPGSSDIGSVKGPLRLDVYPSESRFDD